MTNADSLLIRAFGLRKEYGKDEATMPEAFVGQMVFPFRR